MKILFLSAYFCFPPATGSRIRTLNLLKALTARHQVTFLAFADDEHQKNSLDEARKLCPDTRIVYRNSRYSHWKLLKGMVTSTPFTILNFHHREMEQLARDEQRTGDYDLLHAEGIFMAQYVDFASRCPKILSTHNIESTIMKRFMETTDSRLKRFYARITCGKLHRYESGMFTRFDRTIVVTEQERQLAEAMAPGRPVTVIPNGVDTEFFHPDAAIVEDPATLVFSGLMDSRSNVDAALYFVRDILPQIRREMPGVKLRLLGQRPAAEIQRLADDPLIEVTGFVPDVRPLSLSGALHVVPLRIGAGSRLKILEALALGRAVVSTSVGAEGLDLTPGEHLVIADDSASFAAQTVRLLRAPTLRASLGAAGRRQVVARFDWKSITAPLAPLYEGLVAR